MSRIFSLIKIIHNHHKKAGDYCWKAQQKINSDMTIMRVLKY
jgi:hypothetical protein